MPGVKVTVGGEKRELRYTLRSLRRLDAEGFDITTLAERMTNIDALSAGDRLEVLGLWLWAGLLHGNPDLTRDEAEDLIELGELEGLIGKIGEAMGVDRVIPPNGSRGTRQKTTPPLANGTEPGHTASTTTASTAATPGT